MHNQFGNILLESLIAITLTSLAILSFSSFSLKTSQQFTKQQQEYVMAKQISILTQRLSQAKKSSLIAKNWQKETEQLLPNVEIRLQGNLLQFKLNQEDPLREIIV